MTTITWIAWAFIACMVIAATVADHKVKKAVATA